MLARLQDDMDTRLPRHLRIMRREISLALRLRQRQGEKVSLPVQVSSFEVFLVFGESFFEMADSLIKMNKRYVNFMSFPIRGSDSRRG